MRVLNGRILVAIAAKSSDDLIPSDYSSEGRVEVSGSAQIHVGDTVQFGKNKEEIEIGGRRYLLMEEDNVKVIFDGPNSPNDNVLPFAKREERLSV